MTAGYKIKDIAERSGFTAATLRYYEGIGLLPASTRTPAGYQPEALSGRLDEWQALLAHVTRWESVDDGVRVVFGPATPLDELIHLTAAEHDCCRFFDFIITVDTRGVALEVRASTDAGDVLHGLFGSPA